MALPRQTPSPSLASDDTLVNPAATMRSLACPSVKLLAPLIGAPGSGALAMKMSLWQDFMNSCWVMRPSTGVTWARTR